MIYNNKHYRALWMESDTLCMIDQNQLPYKFEIFYSRNVADTCFAIKTMITRGAGSIGAAGAYGMLQAINSANPQNIIQSAEKARKQLNATRPTAANLFYATERVFNALSVSVEFARKEAFAVADECAEQAKIIGKYGNELIKDGDGILTHCNAGWLALVDYGSALAPVYEAFDNNKNIFVFVDETRPRSQGAKLTAWELLNYGVPHAIIPDNAAAHYMAKNEINIVITGADRIAANGDTANKIGTLEKAIAAKYFNIPFFIAAPLSTIDKNTKTGRSIPIEERNADEVNFVTGIGKNQKLSKILVSNPGSGAFNPAFDITPAELITGIITEKGIIKPNSENILKLFES